MVNGKVEVRILTGINTYIILADNRKSLDKLHHTDTYKVIALQRCRSEYIGLASY
jgi:hypothetical protein